ncbi:hypothetical protein VTK73DRAFT_6609 [Phialemonium thermophilum]|uniref:Ribosome recycling factor domain-containing protein n=1 Tax=Phialemonium thermophilum TaxID=223376 RepID=A0ABR3WIJ7_9PEZI
MSFTRQSTTLLRSCSSATRAAFLGSQHGLCFSSIFVGHINSGRRGAVSPPPPPTAHRFLHATTCLAKSDTKDRRKAKGDVTNSKAKSSGTAAAEPSSSSSEGGRPKPNPEDPFDFTDLEFAWNRAAERYEEQLKQLRAGGRFNAEAIGAVRVRPDKSNPGQTFPLHELAAVVPRGGRTIAVLVHEAANVKPVMSAIQSSPDFNQQPQRSEDNELELLLRVEPERKDGLLKRAKETCHAWREQIRAERHRRDVVHKKWRKDNIVTSDDKTRLDKELQKLLDKRMAQVDAKEKEVLLHISRETR